MWKFFKNFFLACRLISRLFQVGFEEKTNKLENEVAILNLRGVIDLIVIILFSPCYRLISEALFVMTKSVLCQSFPEDLSGSVY